MTKEWHKHFPFPTIRDGQEGVIDQIIETFSEGKNRFVFLDAPTGTGKSGIGLTIGRHFDSAYYITAQKILQTQLSHDFGEEGVWRGNGSPLVELKGRNAYPCNFYSRALNDPEFMKKVLEERKDRYQELAVSGVDCAKGECKRIQKTKLKFCEGHCPYFNQLDRAMNAKLTMMNFHSFLYQTQMVPERWVKKPLLIIDECHNTEQVLMEFISLTLTDHQFGLTFPVYESASEYLIFLEDNGVAEMMIEKIKAAALASDDENEEYWKQQALKYAKFKHAICESDEEWVVKYEKKEKWATIELKPLFINKFTESLLFGMADNILLMSATILNPKIFADSLGIKNSEYKYVKLANKFPKENRPIIFKPSGSMSYKSKQETIKKLFIDVEKICNEHANDRGIIHTHTFEIADYLIKNCSKSVTRRFFYQNDYSSKQDMLRQHAESKNGIILAPAMHEGLDLKGDLSRFQIITKVPYPSLANNPQLEKRMRISNDYYMYLTGLKLVQSYGRSVRSETDWAKTYVVDSDFKSFCSRSYNILPDWFLEAVIW